MKEAEMCYSSIPALQEFVAPQSTLDPSRMNVMAEGLLQVQMDLSRCIMFEEEWHNSDDPRVRYIRSAMSCIAEIYDEFAKIEEARLQYAKALQSMQ